MVPFPGKERTDETSRIIIKLGAFVDMRDAKGEGPDYPISQVLAAA